VADQQAALDSRPVVDAFDAGDAGDDAAQARCEVHVRGAQAHAAEPRDHLQRGQRARRRQRLQVHMPLECDTALREVPRQRVQHLVEMGVSGVADGDQGVVHEDRMCRQDGKQRCCAKLLANLTFHQSQDIPGSEATLRHR
jgi:hypothetical protein